MLYNMSMSEQAALQQCHADTGRHSWCDDSMARLQLLADQKQDQQQIASLCFSELQFVAHICSSYEYSVLGSHATNRRTAAGTGYVKTRLVIDKMQKLQKMKRQQDVSEACWHIISHALALLLQGAGNCLGSVSCGGLQPSIFSLLLLQPHIHGLHTRSKSNPSYTDELLHSRHATPPTVQCTSQASLALAYTTHRTMSAFKQQSPLLI